VTDQCFVGLSDCSVYHYLLTTTTTSTATATATATAKFVLLLLLLTTLFCSTTVFYSSSPSSASMTGSNGLKLSLNALVRSISPSSS